MGSVSGEECVSKVIVASYVLYTATLYQHSYINAEYLIVLEKDYNSSVQIHDVTMYVQCIVARSTVDYISEGLYR
jgi:hypothetical protein